MFRFQFPIFAKQWFIILVVFFLLGTQSWATQAILTFISASNLWGVYGVWLDPSQGCSDIYINEPQGEQRLNMDNNSDVFGDPLLQNTSQLSKNQSHA